MQLAELTNEGRAALEAAQQPVHRVREWQRFQAVRLLANCAEVAAVAQAPGCRASAVYYWAEAWMGGGLERGGRGWPGRRATRRTLPTTERARCCGQNWRGRATR